jgi:soluble lytic murein transglycosylase-like protein
LLLVLLSLLLVSGRSLTPVPRDAPQESLESPQDVGRVLAARDVEAILVSVNPSLDPRSSRRIAAAVMYYSARYQLDPELVTAVLLVESHARPWAVSPKGAMGLMQVMPHMMQPLGLAGNAVTIESNIQAGCYILANNIRRLGEDRGISSYFWGNSIRGVVYLEKVRAARERLRGRMSS